MPAQPDAGQRGAGDQRRPQPGKSGPMVGRRLVAAVVVGALAGAVVGLVATWQFGLLLGWMVTAATYVGWLWLSVGRMDAPSTAAHAVREDPGRATTDAIVVGAAVASLGAVAMLLSRSTAGPERNVAAVLSVCSVGLAWAAVHTTFATRYARLYYDEPEGGVDFGADPPRYADFAYLSFTIGMTFQVSDTALRGSAVRATVLRHALLSYLFGTVVIAAVINLVAGLAR